MSKRNKITFLAAITGNILEYYDFTVYGIFSVSMAALFFPSESKTLSLILTLMGFSIGFITRPIGGIILGYIGDNFGRRVSLLVSALGMSLSTIGIGILPSYQCLGVLSPILLVIFRLIQGIVLSGEGTGTAIFLLEHFAKKKMGLITGIVQCCNIIGSLLAGLVCLLLNKLLGNNEYNWRIAFLIGGFCSFFSLCLRMYVSETPVFIELQKSKSKKSKFLEIIRCSWRQMIICFFVAGAASSILQFIKCYLKIYLVNLGIYENMAVKCINYSFLIVMFFMVIFAHLSDRLGKVKILNLSAMLIFLLIVPIFYLFLNSKDFNIVFIVIPVGLLAGAICGSAYIFVISIFRPENRFLGVSFSYNLGVAVFGGTSPMICNFLICSTGIMCIPAFYISFTSLLLLLAMKIMKKDIEKNLSG